MTEASDRQRLDKWLWHARVVRTRSAAQALVEAGYVRIGGVRAEASSKAVKRGDVLTIALERRVLVLEVAGFAPRRGDAANARLLYVDRSPEPVQDVELEKPGRQGPRPTKRNRRRIDDLDPGTS